jgi:2,4-dichlorophenol 6-monooxygenase
LIAGEDGGAWYEAARRLAASEGIPLDVIRVGHASGDYRDPRCAWLRQREITARGCVLVRPDRFVAWRSREAVADAGRALAAVLTRLLGRVEKAVAA